MQYFPIPFQLTEFSASCIQRGSGHQQQHQQQQ